MAVIISIASQKGGTGKTTTTVCLADTLGFLGKKTLLVDLDSQGNSTYASGVDNPEKTITDVLGGECAAGQAVIQCSYHDILCADEFLTNVENSEDVSPDLLKNSIADITGLYDFIIIDTPPALGRISINALVASDFVLIPTETSPFAAQGITTLNNTIEYVRNGFNPSLTIIGILLIKFNSRTVLSRDLRQAIKEYAKTINTSVFDASIRNGISVQESQTVRQPLIDYAKNSKPNLDYMAFTDELLRRIGG